MILDRYESRNEIVTPRDPLQEMLVHLEYLRSADYVQEVLTKHHGATAAGAKQRVSAITAHTRLACSYVAQALDTSDETAFLTGYYAILNLLKLYILFSPRHADLPANRWHGASYDVFGKDSHSLLTEVVVLRSAGAIPLVYELLTGARIKDRTAVQLRDVYPFMRGITNEWSLAGQRTRLAALEPSLLESRGVRTPVITVHFGPLSGRLSARDLKVLSGYKKDPGAARFLGTPEADVKLAPSVIVRNGLRPFLLYSNPEGRPFTPVSRSTLLLPQELPIAIAFFHLSSVVRYKPEFVARLRDSRFWPVVACLRYYGLLHFTVLLWSYLHQRTLFIHVK